MIKRIQKKNLLQIKIIKTRTGMKRVNRMRRGRVNQLM
jgi:hypothetical protein